MKIPIKFGNMNWPAWKARLSFLRSGKMVAVFYLILAGTIGCSIYFWYDYITNQGWNEDQKKAYLEKREKDVAFDEKGFKRIIEYLEQRKANSAKKISDVPDIFRLKH